MRSGILLVDAENQFILCDAMEMVENAEPVHIVCGGVDAIDYLSSLPHDNCPVILTITNRATG